MSEQVKGRQQTYIDETKELLAQLDAGLITQGECVNKMATAAINFLNAAG